MRELRAKVHVFPSLTHPQHCQKGQNIFSDHHVA